MEKCETCGQSAVMHVTDLSQSVPTISHFCGEHSPLEFAETVRREVCRLWGDGEGRDAISEILSRKSGVSADKVREAIDKYVRQFRGNV